MADFSVTPAFGDSDFNRIFMDIDTIEPGEDFVAVIENAVGSCEILIAIIGRNWLSGTGVTTGRLDNPNDFVRVEIATALRRDIRVIPVLVQRATMPTPQDLPDDLTKLTRRNAVELSDLRWQNDVEELISVMERILARQEEARRKTAQEEEEERERQEAETRKAEEAQRQEDELRRREEEEAARRAEEERQRREAEGRRREEEAQRRLAEEEAARRAAEERRRTEEEIAQKESDEVKLGLRSSSGRRKYQRLYVALGAVVLIALVVGLFAYQRGMKRGLTEPQNNIPASNLNRGATPFEPRSGSEANTNASNSVPQASPPAAADVKNDNNRTPARSVAKQSGAATSTRTQQRNKAKTKSEADKQINRILNP